MLNEIQITENYDKLIGIINKEFNGERKETLLKMYDHFATRMAVAPASSRDYFHHAFPGGYVQHILNVYNRALDVVKLFSEAGGIVDFKREELVFSALHHDLGKLGDEFHECYIEQDSDWHRKNMGQVYKFNPILQYMSATDRALYLLQQFGIKVEMKEFLAIKLSDGLYDSSNESYYKSFKKETALKTSLPYIIHWADHISTRIEQLQDEAEINNSKTNFQNKYKKILKNDSIKEAPAPKIVTKFEDIFTTEEVQ